MPKYNLSAGERCDLHGIRCENRTSQRIVVWFQKTNERAAGVILIGEYLWRIEAQATERKVNADILREHGTVTALVFSELQ